MTFKRSLVSLGVLLALTGCETPSTSSQQAAVAASPTPRPLVGEFHFLTGASLDPDQLLSPFPASSDPEITAMEKLLQSRTPADCKRIESEVVESLDAFYGPKTGILGKKDVEKWTAFIEAVTDDAEIYTNTLKDRFGRVRPYLEAEDKIHPCPGMRMPKSGSYPSGHSTNAWLMADVLTQLDPAHKTTYEKRADQIAHDRVLAGAHFPSDIEAGHKLAGEIFEALNKTASYPLAVEKLKITGSSRTRK